MKKTQPIKVYCRLKPSLLKNEKSIKYEIKKKNGQEIICFNYKKFEQFQFQNVFSEDATQGSIFELVAIPILDKFLNGTNCTIFTYGQTGSGKTHTIVGSNNDKGIIPRSFQYIFTQNAALNSTEENEIISLSYFQVYNEEIYDLIPLEKSGHNKNMKLTDRVKFVVNVNGDIEFKNLNIVRVKNVKEALDMLKSGKKNRRILSTTMNDQSSRSHCICKITHLNKKSEFETILNLVDLAGSERISKNANIDKKILAESRHINISLLYLHQVINTLSNDIRQKHVPYRNSIITLLLKGSLGYKCATAMISTIVLNDRSIAESVSTLRYTKDVSGVKHIIEEPKTSIHKRSLKMSETKIKLLSTSQYGNRPSGVKNIVKTERSLHERYVELSENVQDSESISQYSKGGSGDNNIVKTERPLQEPYVELSEKLNVIGHDIKQLQTHLLGREDGMIPPRVNESGDGNSNNLKTTKDVSVMTREVGDDKLTKYCQTMDVNSSHRSVGSGVGDVTSASKRCGCRVISNYRNYCILLIIILNIVFMGMWSKEQEINTVKFHSDMKYVKPNPMIDYKPTANSINNFIIVFVLIVMALSKFRLNRIRTNYDDVSTSDSSILHTPKSIQPLSSNPPAVDNCEQEIRGINLPRLQDTTCPYLTPESVRIKYIADGYGIWRRTVIPTPTSIRPVSRCLPPVDKGGQANGCKKRSGLQDVACTCVICDYQCHLNE